MSDETYSERLDRVKLMAANDPTWDLSDNDIAALNAVLDRLAECERQLTEAGLALRDRDT